MLFGEILKFFAKAFNLIATVETGTLSNQYSRGTNSPLDNCRMGSLITGGMVTGYLKWVMFFSRIGVFTPYN